MNTTGSYTSTNQTGRVYQPGPVPPVPTGAAPYGSPKPADKKRSAYSWISLGCTGGYSFIALFLILFIGFGFNLVGWATGISYIVQQILWLLAMIFAAVAVHRDKKKDVAITSLVLSILVPIGDYYFWWFVYWPLIGGL